MALFGLFGETTIYHRNNTINYIRFNDNNITNMNLDTTKKKTFCFYLCYVEPRIKRVLAVLPQGDMSGKLNQIGTVTLGHANYMTLFNIVC